MVFRDEELRLGKGPVAAFDVGFGEEAGVGRRRVRIAEERADGVAEGGEGFESRPREDNGHADDGGEVEQHGDP